MDPEERWVYVLEDAGVVSALGCGAEATLAALDAGGAEGLREVGGLPDGGKTFFGFAPPETVSAEAVLRAGSRVGALVDAAMEQIAPTLGRILAEAGAERVGAVVGTSNSTMEEFTDDPRTIDMSYPAGRIAGRWGVRGPAWAVSTACSSSAKVFASARWLLAEGLCDAVVAGGADAYTRTVVGGFHALEALSAEPTRPLAADRDGLSLGEGAAFFVMRRARAGESDGERRQHGAGGGREIMENTWFFIGFPARPLT